MSDTNGEHSHNHPGKEEDWDPGYYARRAQVIEA